METFKVGDEVESVEDVGVYYNAGARGTIVKMDGSREAWVRFHTGKYSFPFGCMGGWHAFTSWLRHVQPPAPVAPAVTSRAVVLDVGGVEYTAMFTFVGDRTGVVLYWRKDNHEYGLAGGTKRNPRDEYSAETGMRQAMRRACGIGQPEARQLPAVYRAFRQWQHDQAAPEQPKSLEVGAEVVAVKDDYSGGMFFHKGARGEIVMINDATRTGQKYIVKFSGGDFCKDCHSPHARDNGTWAARADEIEAV